MASRNRDMSSASSMHQFGQRNHGGMADSRAFLNQDNQQNCQHTTTPGQRQNPFPIPPFNPGVPPPSITAALSSQKSTEISQSYSGSRYVREQGISSFGPRADGGKYSKDTGTYQNQKLPDSTQSALTLPPETNSTFYPKHNQSLQHGNDMSYQAYQPRNTIGNTPFDHGRKTVTCEPRNNTPYQHRSNSPFQHGNNLFHRGNTVSTQPRNVTNSQSVGNIPPGKNLVFHSGNPPHFAHQPGSGTSFPPGNTTSFPPGNTTSFPHANNPPFMIPRNNPPFSFPPPMQASPSIISPGQNTSQEEFDRSWVNQWLEQRQIKKTSNEPKKATIKIGEAQKLMQRCLCLNEQLKSGRDELIKNIDLPDQEWNECLTKINTIKNELLSVQKILSDPAVIQNLKEKINERQKKRLWFKNRMKRQHLEKIDDVKRRERLQKEIGEWQKEKTEKDLAARKEATLKREAGGVLGEVRRKQTEGRKLRELLQSIKKLREIRKSEGEKKGIYPKTTSENDRKFTEKSEFMEKSLTKRIESYEDEEKALRVMLVEEEEEREKKEVKERLEQKALLNLSIEPDPLADFRRYYDQAEQGIAFLIQIRSEWDTYIVPGHVFGASMIPGGELYPSPPSNDFWSSVLVDTGNNEELSTG